MTSEVLDRPVLCPLLWKEPKLGQCLEVLAWDRLGAAPLGPLVWRVPRPVIHSRGRRCGPGAVPGLDQNPCDNSCSVLQMGKVRLGDEVAGIAVPRGSGSVAVPAQGWCPPSAVPAVQ